MGLARSQIGLLITALLFFYSSTAQAQRWNYATVACLPTPESLTLVTVSGGAVTFASGQTGTATLRCRVSPGLFTQFLGFRLTYQDTSGTGTNGQATLRLMQIDKTTGEVTQVAGKNGHVYKVDSNDSYLTNVYTGVNENADASILDAGNYYYFEVTLMRSDTTTTVSAYGVSALVFT